MRMILIALTLAAAAAPGAAKDRGRVPEATSDRQAGELHHHQPHPHDACAQ